ncbi:MAG: hypothetical protein AAF456_01495 [Planctomycetota bacterium]
MKLTRCFPGVAALLFLFLPGTVISQTVLLDEDFSGFADAVQYTAGAAVTGPGTLDDSGWTFAETGATLDETEYETASGTVIQNVVNYDFARDANNNNPMGGTFLVSPTVAVPAGEELLTTTVVWAFDGVGDTSDQFLDTVVAFGFEDVDNFNYIAHAKGQMDQTNQDVSFRDVDAASQANLGSATVSEPFDEDVFYTTVVTHNPVAGSVNVQVFNPSAVMIVDESRTHFRFLQDVSTGYAAAVGSNNDAYSVQSVRIESDVLPPPLPAPLAEADFNDLVPGAVQNQMGGTGWGLASSWGNTGTIDVIAGDLVAPVSTNYGIVQSGTPQSLQGSNTGGRQTTRETEAPLQGTVWFSYLMNNPTINSRSGITFNRNSSAPSNPRIVATGDEVRIALASLQAAGTGVPINLGETYLILGRLTLNQTGDETLEVWVNPDVSGGIAGLPAPDNTLIEDASILDVGLNRVGVQSYGSDNIGGIMDVVRVSDTATAFEDVTGIAGGAQTVFPTSITPVNGNVQSGGVPELTFSDNTDFSMARRSADIQARITYEVKSVSPVAMPATFEITVEGSVFARPAVTQTVELFDYDTGTWEQVDTRNASRFGDTVVTIAPGGDLSRFVEPGTNCIEARIRFVAAAQRALFTSNTDQVVWTIE